MLENFRSQKIIWDRANKKIFEKIEANSGDSNGRKLVVQVINQGVIENLFGTTLSLGWKHRKGAKGLDAFDVVDASKGIFEIYYTTEMLSNIGDIKASLILINSTGRIESSTFTINVRPSTVDDESVESENSFTALTEALVKVTDLENNYAPRLNDLTVELAQTAIYGKSYGMVMDGVTDDTVAFRNAIAQAIATGKKLIINGDIRITDEIVITKQIWIESQSLEFINSKSKGFTTIFLDNSEVDVNGNATKCALRFKDAHNYNHYNTKVKNIAFKSLNTTAKNQHAIIFDGADIGYSNFENLYFREWSGYSLFFTGGVYFQNATFKNINNAGVGGVLGNGGVTHFSNISTWENINLDGGINRISPQRVIYDFRGFGWVTINQILSEGSLPSNIPTDFACFAFDRTTKITGFWNEWSGATQPPILMEIYDTFVAIDLVRSGISDTSESKIIMVGENPHLKCNHFSAQANLEEYIEFTSITGVVEIDYLIVDKIDKATIREKNIGRIKINNVKTWYGTDDSNFHIYNNVPLYIHEAGFLKNNKYVQFSSALHTTNIELVNDQQEGRVLKYSNTDNNNAPQFTVNISRPTFIENANITMSIRYKIETTDTTALVRWISGGKLSIGDAPVVNEWRTALFSSTGKTGNISMYLNNITSSAPTSLYIADIQVHLGDKLPYLLGTTTGVINTLASSVPTSGYYVKGDYIENTNPTILGTSPNKYVVNGWKRLTTGTAHVLNMDWVEDRALTGQ